MDQKRFIHLFLILAVCQLFSCSIKNPNYFNLAKSDYYILTADRLSPDESGVVYSAPLPIPNYQSGYFFASYEGRRSWPSHANQLIPWHFTNDISQVLTERKNWMPHKDLPADKHGEMLLLKLSDNDYLTILPLVSTNSAARLKVSTANELQVELVNMGTDLIHGETPFVSWGRAENPYESLAHAWQKAISIPQIGAKTNLRRNRDYPEVFNYLGWCTWEQYRDKIDQKTFLEGWSHLDSLDSPVRWILLDDGYQHSEKEEIRDEYEEYHPRRLISHATDPVKFPDNFSYIKERKADSKIKWVGIWHAFSTLWGGLHSEHTLEVETLENKFLTLPTPQEEGIGQYYGELATKNKKDGFDFVKVDVQSLNMEKFYGLANPVEITNAYTDAMETAMASQNLPIINCMAMSNINQFNTPYSAITRVSQDYLLGNEDYAKAHLYQSYSSTLWLGHTAYPDHDMFHSSDTISGRMMAVSKALSAGPIYLSDNPLEINQSLVQALCYSNGELLRPLAPAIPTTHSIFTDPFTQPNPYLAIAPLRYGGAALAVYNFTRENIPVEGYISTDIYGDASGMLQPYPGPWGVPSEGLVLYNWYDKVATELTDSVLFQLDNFDDLFFLLLPIESEWAFIGNTDKYLSNSVIGEIEYRENEVELQLREPGSFVFYLKNAQPESPDFDLIELGNQLWMIDFGDLSAVNLTLRKNL